MAGRMSSSTETTYWADRSFCAGCAYARLSRSIKMNLPPGFKDWRTSLPAFLLAICWFVHDHPHYFWPLVVDLAGWMMSVGFAIFGINTASSFMVKQKTPQQVDALLVRRGLVTPREVVADPVDPKELKLPEPPTDGIPRS